MVCRAARRCVAAALTLGSRRALVHRHLSQWLTLSRPLISTPPSSFLLDNCSTHDLACACFAKLVRPLRLLWCAQLHFCASASMAAAQASQQAAYELYRRSSVGVALADVLDEFISNRQIEPQLALKIIANFDKAIAETLAEKVKNRCNFKVWLNGLHGGWPSETRHSSPSLCRAT